MRKLISPGRLVFLSLIVLTVLTVFFAKLYQLQIVEGNQAFEDSVNSIVSYEDVIAARGNIMDRYGRLLVSNRSCNNLLIKDHELLMNDDISIDEANAIILKMCRLIEENGDQYNDELPITMTPPWEFTDMSATQSLLLSSWLTANQMDPDASAVEIMAKMRSRYSIDGNYSAEDMRVIAGVRYCVNVRYDINTSAYVFAQDVSINTITSLMEADLPGFEVQVSYMREYNTTYAPHILGYTGLMSAEQYERYKDQDYPLNAIVGQSGVEAAFESLLHGVDGRAEITRTSDGVVTGTTYTKTPQPGNNIYLTLDIKLQAAAESTLANYIESTNAQTEIDNEDFRQKHQLSEVRELITGGAIVAIDVKTGEPLAMASYPSFNLETYWDDYSTLLEAENNPLVNRVLSGLYSPGSTWKPCMAVAGIDTGFLNKDKTITCTTIFDKYINDGYAPGCTGGPHGALNVSGALTYSCNFFFFTVGDTIGIDNIDKYAKMLGLGEPTGIELAEATGRVASPAYKAQLYAGTPDQAWYAADTLLASIGQGLTGITPLQLGRYAAAIANKGTVYSCSLLKSASSYDYSESVYEREPEVMSKVDTGAETWRLIHEGMRGAVTERWGTAHSPFAGFEYEVAAKTGTTETGSSTNDAFFICFAPYQDPQIAVAVAIENGSKGANLGVMARDMLQYYFDFQVSTQQTENELTLLR